MNVAAFIIGLLIVAQGIVGLIAPEFFMQLIQSIQTPPTIYVAAVVRVAFGIVLVLAAPLSRAPIALRVLGALIALGGAMTPFHMVAVPFFMASFACGIWLLVSGRVLLALLCFLGLIVSLAVQGFGHKMEPVPAEPFRGPLNFLQRIFLEQFYRYWVFVFSGAWFRTIQASRGRHGT